MDGNTAAIDVAHRLNEVCAIYPITPSSPMGELADAWSHTGRTNLWGQSPRILEMQSEAGAAGALHGALQTGALATTFTSSQGLLLMLPNLYKIAGELSPCVIHVAARALATHALSIFGDHSDVMSARATGFAMLFAANVQEAHDFALLSQAVSLQSRIPFLHIFDGFRTSHELVRISRLPDDTLLSMLDPQALCAHRERALNPNHPVIRGTSQNPDVFFQSREAVNPFYHNLPEIFNTHAETFARLTGRTYAPVSYHGAADADRVIVLMGSATETVQQTVDHLNAQDQKTGCLRISLYRPWPAEAFLDALPASVRAIAVLDRTKEPGSFADPLFLDVAATLLAHRPHIQLTGGRYGLGSKEFTPAMAAAAFRDLNADTPKPRFTLGIEDDLTHLSLPACDLPGFNEPGHLRAIFHGLGADGTVGANRNTVRILSEQTPLHAQAYFVFDSNKSGSRTVSHLRVADTPFQAPYLIQTATFIACHQFSFLQSIDILHPAAPGATLLLNTPHGAETIYRHLPSAFVDTLRDRQIKLHVIDAARVARQAGLGGRINTVMQTCFFALTNLLPLDRALNAIRQSIADSYGKLGSDTVQKNLAAVEAALDALQSVPPPDTQTSPDAASPDVPNEDPFQHAPPFIRNITARLVSGEGDRLPVSAMPPDGTWPTGTAPWNRRDLSPLVPEWIPDLCIQCGHCVMICPHGVIRTKAVSGTHLENAPPDFPAAPLRGVPPDSGLKYLLQISLPDCTGCGLCVEICPAKDKTQPKIKSLNMGDKGPRLPAGEAAFDFFQSLPDNENPDANTSTVRGVQFLPTTFEFPGACAGCGETPYLKLLSQLFGDRMLVANATGCSSIYGGNLPVTPWTTDSFGRGPAWANSLFEDNAEFGLGFRLGVDALQTAARQSLQQLITQHPSLTDPAQPLLRQPPPETPRDFTRRRQQLATLLTAVDALPDTPLRQRFQTVADHFIPRSLWIIGGDGWAYDIGFGGLEHVLCTGENLNILVLDTEVYSNTGGQASKATPIGAAAKFAAAGKSTHKNDLALTTVLKGNVYVATLALGAKLPQALRAIREAEAFPGPSLLIAYSPCIAHGYDLRNAIAQETRAVTSGYWPLFRYDPRKKAAGEPALMIDSPDPTLPLKEFLHQELRFRLPAHANPQRAEAHLTEAKIAIQNRFSLLKKLSES